MLLLACGLFAILYPIESHSLVIHVPGDQPTIQAGLDAAASGDVVQIACGDYYESEITLKSGVALRGEASDAGCVVLHDVSGLSAVDLLDDTVVEGLRFLGDSQGASGAFMDIRHAALEIRDCEFEEFESALLWVIRCADSRLVVKDCRFQEISGFLVGGFIDLEASVASFDNCDFRSVRSYTPGTIEAHASSLSMRDCSLIDSNAVKADAGSAIDMIRCEFHESDGVVSEGTLRAESCTFARGGGVVASGVAELVSCSLLLSETSEDAVRFTGDGRLDMEACLVAYNVGGAAVRCDAQAAFDIRCCNFVGNGGGDWIGPLADLLGADGNMRALPLLCDVAYDHDYRLQPDSPCAPENSACGALVGAQPVGCATTAVESRSWSSIKAIY